MTTEQMRQIVDRQFASEYHCTPAQLHDHKFHLTDNALAPDRRHYGENGAFFRLLAYSGTAVCAVDAAVLPQVQAILGAVPPEWCFDFKKLWLIENAIRPHGHFIANVQHFYLPALPCRAVVPPFKVRWLEQADILPLRGDERFPNAFTEHQERPDMLAVAAMDGETILGMAGASADCGAMWQIGIDTLPASRGRGIAPILVELLKNEILARGFVPFYSTGESHNASKKTAIRAGFLPAWAEAYSKALPAGEG